MPSSERIALHDYFHVVAARIIKQRAPATCLREGMLQSRDCLSQL